VELLDADDGSGRAWEVRYSDRVVGRASLGPGSAPAARHLRLEVEPGYRRRGIGTRLLVTASEAARSDGCLHLEAMVVRGSPGVAFTAVHGAVIGDELIDAVLDLARADVGRLTTFAAAVPDGYRLTSWSEPTPARYVESYARAKWVIADAPNRFPPPTPRWTAAEVREAEHRRREQGTHRWVAACLAADEVVAFSEASTDASARGEQHDTGVLADHRRQGLARAVKARLVLRLRAERPDVRSLGATYAAANTGMHAVSRDLGFREHRRRDLVRLPIRAGGVVRPS
jgi:GNAT superfamily N-acetyltransferase